MKLQVHGDKMIVTKAIKDYLEEKSLRLERYFDNNDEIKAVINVRVKNNLQTVEISIPTKYFMLRAEVSHSDLYASIDLAIDILERQITKNKKKIQKKYKHIPEFDMNMEFEAEEEKLDLVKRKNLDIKPMDEEEAMLQMQLVNHDFFVFKNLDEECVSVLYKRKDGKFGIINVK